MKITDYSVRRHLATAALVLGLLVLGFYGLFRLPVDYLPELAYPVIRVSITWPGTTPGEVDRDIAEPLERRMATVDRVDYLESTCREGSYTLAVNFEYGVDVDVAFQDVLAAVSRVQRRLPADIDAPLVFKMDPSQAPVISLVIASDLWGPVELRDWAENHLQNHLLAARGVAGVEIAGGLAREIRVLVDPLAVEKHGLSLPAVARRLAEENVEQPGGRVITGRREIILRTAGDFQGLEDIRSVLLLRRGGGNLYLGDIAEVTDSHEDERVLARLDGEPGIRLSVLKEAGANTVEVAREVRSAMEALAPSLPEGLRVNYLGDQARYVSRALSGVLGAALQAMFLLMLVVYLFLGSFRRVMVMLIALPLTIIFNFGIMKLAGFSLNIFSLGGLVVAIGVVIDTSIIVLENITRHRREEPGVPAEAQAVSATAEVGSAVIASTLSFLSLFLPFIMVPGLITMLFREQVLVIAGIVGVSLLVAVTLTPMLTVIFLRGEKVGRRENFFERFFARILGGYGRFLGRVVRARALTIAVFAGFLIAAIILAGRLGGEFMPLVDDGQVTVRVTMPTGTAMRETDLVAREIEAILAADPMVESAFTVVGGRLFGAAVTASGHTGQVSVQLVPRAARELSTAGWLARTRPLLSGIHAPGGRIMARPVPPRGIRGMQAADLIVEVRGPEMDGIAAQAARVAEVMRGTELFENVSVDLDLSRPEYRVVVDRPRAAELGVSVSEIGGTLRSLVSGVTVGRFREADRQYDIRLMVSGELLASHRDIENLPVAGAGGNIVRVRDVARIIESVGPLEITRKNQSRQVRVEGNLAGGTLAGAVGALGRELGSLDWPAGYSYEFSGSAGLLAEMARTVLVVLGFALFFSLVVLTVQFNSFRLAAIILGSIPFSLAGLVFGLYLAGIPFGATVLVGILVVIALTVNDGVLITTFAEQLRRERGIDPGEAVLESARIRLRPRLMTTITTMAGFMPLALNLGGGGEMLVPMAVGAIAGLAMEALVSLFLMPCLYAFLSPRTSH